MSGQIDPSRKGERRRPSERLTESVVEATTPDHLLLDDSVGLRDFVEQIEEAIYLADPNGAIIDGNPALIRILGAASLDEIIGRRIADFMVDPEVRRAFDRQLAEGEVRSGLEFRIRAQNGTYRWVRDVSHRQCDKSGETIAYRGVLVDVTEHQLTVHALQESEQKYRAIFENVQDIYYRTDVNGTIVEVSPAVKRHLGYERNEIIGRQIDSLYPDPTDRELLRNRLLDDGEVTGFEVELKRKDGNPIWFSVNARLLLGANDQPLGWIISKALIPQVLLRL